MKRLPKILFFSIIIFIGLVASIGAVKNNTKTATTMERGIKLSSVSDFSYTMGGKQSASIVLAKDKYHYVDLTIHRDEIKAGAHFIKNKHHINDTIDVTAQWDGNCVLMLSKGSSLEVSIDKIDKDKKIATMSINATLLNTKTNKPVKFSASNILFSGKNYQNLIVKIKE